MDFRNFFILHVIQVKESISRQFPRSYHVRVTSKIQVNFRFRRYSRVLLIGVMDFSNFYNPYVSDVKESVLGSFARPCSGDLEHIGQLPVLQELEATVNLVSWISVISSFFTLSRSRNLFLAVSRSYHVRVTSKIQVNFRFRRYSRVLLIGSYGFQ